MSEVPKHQAGCDSCGYKTRELESFGFGFDDVHWLCRVCSHTFIPSATLHYTDRFSRGEATILKTIGWGINAILDEIRASK